MSCLISIIIPYDYDRGFLTEAVKSCAFQDFKSYEIIVQQGFQSTAKNINDGIKKSIGKYIKLCGEDDVLLPNCLSDLYKAVKGNDFTAGHCINFINQKFYTRFVSIPKDVNALAEKNTLHGLGMLYSRKALEDVSENGMYFNEDLNAFEELELHFRLLHFKKKLSLCNSIVAKYRMHPKQKSFDFNNGLRDPDRTAKREEMIKKWTYQ